MGGGFLMLVLWMFYYFSAVSANGERDALMTFKSNLSDPDNVLTSWDSKDVNPCTWHLITCNNDNEVTEIHLGNANLSGHLVAQLGSLSNLISLELYSNNISGKIPPELGNLTSLERLELYQNNLSGPIPDELGKLYKLRMMRLNNNTLSGRIPVSLTTISSLQVLDVAVNNLSGIIPLNGSFSFFNPISFRDNPYLENATILSIPYSTAERVKVGNGSTGAIAAGISAGATFLFGVFATALVWWRRRKDQNHFCDVSGEDDPETQMGALYWFYPRALHRFSLTDLQVATDNFDPKNVVGRGGFGQVYKGCLADGSLVAVKRLKDAHNKVEELQFQTEVEMISLVVHPNLLRLQGFCMTPTEKLLVYPFMANGSVASCLQAGEGSQPLLDWPKRKQIALGSARGLAYLHHQFDPKVIHRDVKAANILLDDEFEAVVGDFGLVKLMGFEDSHLTTLVCGTIGHIAPEYLSHGKCSEKTDVFGYGVMLLELLSGQKATDLAKLAIDDGFMLHDRVRGLLKDEKLERLVDGNLRGDSYVEEEVEQLIQLALLSTHNSPAQRPTMCELVRMLQGDGLAKRWQKQDAFYRESNYALLANRTWILDSTSKLRPDQLSGPR